MNCVLVFFGGKEVAEKKEHRIMRPYAANRIRNICSISTVPNQAEWLKKFVFKMVNLKIGMTKRRITLNVLDRLNRIGIGTNEIEIWSRRYHFGGGRIVRDQEKEAQRKQFVRREMGVRIQDARMQLKKETAKYRRYYKYFMSTDIARYGYNKRLNDIMQEEVEHEWRRGVEKLQSKVRHLQGKWGATLHQPQIWKGIAIGDKALDEFEGSNEQRRQRQVTPVYGKASITKEQNEVLKLPPGFTTYERILEKDIEAEIEIMATKARWERRSRREREGEGWSEEWQDTEMEQQEVYDSENKKLDLSKKRVTELPTCRRINLPKYEDENLEINLRIMKDRMMSAVKQYKEKHCDGKGNIRNGNLTAIQRKGLLECRKQAKRNKQVFYVTDKSRMMSVDTPENYIEAMDRHMEHDKKVSKKRNNGDRKEDEWAFNNVQQVLENGTEMGTRGPGKKSYDNEGWTSAPHVWP